jgi:hypothetical protein
VALTVVLGGCLAVMGIEGLGYRTAEGLAHVASGVYAATALVSLPVSSLVVVRESRQGTGALWWGVSAFVLAVVPFLVMMAEKR